MVLKLRAYTRGHGKVILGGRIELHLWNLSRVHKGGISNGSKNKTEFRISVIAQGAGEFTRKVLVVANGYFLVLI